ncbi:MAG: L,D-transpeptidase family protein [Pseudomonadota bacterium]
MTHAIFALRFAATLGLASLGGTSTLAADQANSGEAQEAAEAAQQIAQEANEAIRAIDPDTGVASDMADASLPELPPVAGDAAQEAGTEAEGAAPRGAAVRMISEPVMQDLPAPDPVAPTSAQVAQAPAISSDPFVLKSILTIPEGPFRYGDWYWDESAAPAKGTLVVTVDLEARVISAFRDGHEIGTAVALLGTKKHPTPLGSFPILTKEKDNISEKYNNAPMPWTLRLTWSGIAIHGSPVINGYASHGCIGVPDEFAKKLFAAAKRGDKVVITRGQMITVGDRLS